MEPGSAKYNVPVAVRLDGGLETGLLIRALAEIVRRHEPLRTIYTRVDGEPVQAVVPPAASGLAFARVDLGGLPAPARDRALRQGLNAEAARPFDLARGPVVRFLLLDLGMDRRALMATFHHIATDGWSMAIFFRELAVLYADFAAGRPSSLPELPVRYADWAVWQRQALAGGALDAQLAYWRRQLAGGAGADAARRPAALGGHRRPRRQPAWCPCRPIWPAGCAAWGAARGSRTSSPCCRASRRPWPA